MGSNVYIVSDLHVKHRGILRYSPQRISAMGLKDENDIEGHDNYIINMFQEQTKRGDHVYILGDFVMSNQLESLKVINKIKSNGVRLHLIVGNHDKSTRTFFNYFESIDQIKIVTFKKENFPFLDQNFEVVMCHYPMLSWQDKARGSMQLSGHTHWNSPWEMEGDDLRLNVGFDNPMCNYKLFSLEQIYEYYKSKLNGLKPKEYIEKVSKENKRFIR